MHHSEMHTGTLVPFLGVLLDHVTLVPFADLSTASMRSVSSPEPLVSRDECGGRHCIT